MLPASNGQYVIAVTTDGLSATPPPRVLIRTQMATHHMPEEQFELERVAPDRWGTRGAFLSMVGAWDYEVIVRTPGRDDLRHTFSVDTLVVDSASTAPVSLWQRLSLPPTMIAAFAVIGLALLTAAGGSWVANGVPRGVWRRGAIGLVFCSFLLCTVPYYVAIAMTPRNPYDATPEILAAGKATYQKNCLPCHGVAGQGNGPQARGLPVQPANFTLPHYATHPEALLFGWVKNGINGRGMPAFKAALSDKEIWQVMTYISDLNLQANAGDPSKDTPTGP